MARARHARRVRLRRTALTLVAIVVVLSIALVWATTGSNKNVSASGPDHRDSPATSTTNSTANRPPPAPASSSTTTTSATTPPAADPFGTAATSYLAGRTGTVTAAAYDIDTGQTWTLGGGAPQDEASIVKVDILEALLAQSDGQGLSSGDQPVAEDMIENSDNDSATELWDAAGSTAGIASFNSRAGMADTTPSSCVECAGFPWPGWGLTTTDPMDQITLLRKIVEPNSLLTNGERSYALGLMENITPSERWGVSEGVPSGVTVALKNGWLPLNAGDTDWQINSIGWVSGLGRNYLLAVLTTGDPTEQYGIDTIGQLATMAWSSLG